MSSSASAAPPDAAAAAAASAGASAAPRQGVFASVPLMPPTVIFHLTARYKADAHPRRLNLGVGAYRTEALKPYVFSAVRKAEAAVVGAGNDKEYLPITGLAGLNAAAAGLMFGRESAIVKDKRLVSCQSLSGTGALTLAAHFIK